VLQKLRNTVLQTSNKNCHLRKSAQYKNAITSLPVAVEAVNSNTMALLFS